jgi:hypothetical protein
VAGALNTAQGQYYLKLKKDTVIKITDTVKPRKMTLFGSLKYYSTKQNLPGRILHAILKNEQPPNPKDHKKVSEDRFVNLEQKYIRNINIIVLGPFGYSVTEKFGHDINVIQRLGDNIHFTTRTWVIKDKLLFKNGERVDALKTAESERLIRQAPYIVDARISFDPVPGTNDSLDAVVIVQDVFNYTAGASADPKKPNGDLGITDINFLGLGQRFDNKIWYDKVYSQHYKYSGSYSVSEISNTYIAGEVHYNTINFDKKIGLNLSRPFYSTTAKWAGGLDVEYVHEAYNITLDDKIQYTGFHNYGTQDFWLGYAFNLNNKPLYRFDKSQLIISGRSFNITYFDQDGAHENLNRVFHNDVLYLGGIGFTHRDYMKDKYILGFGKTEDVPLGYLFSVNTGPDIGQFFSRWYIGTKAAYSIYEPKAGYFYLSAETGGYLDGTNLEQGVINTQLFYFSNLINVGNCQLRNYVRNRFTVGYNRNPGEILTINGNDGITRFNAPALSGTQKWVNNYEADFFSPWTPFGFRFVLVFYMDDALIQTAGRSIFQSRLFQGYGIGIRFKNEHFIFDAFELSFRIFPDGAAFGGNDWKYAGTGIPAMQFQDFQFSEPYVAPFK